TNTCTKTCSVFRQLDDVLQLRTTTGKDNTTVQALIQPYLLQVEQYIIQYLLCTSLYDMRQVLYRYFFSRQSTQPRYGDICIIIRLCSQCSTKLYLHLLRLRTQYTKSATDIIRDVHTCIRYNSSMLQYAIIEHGHI